MTYLEKYKQDHPNGSVNVEEMCPTHFGYELPFCANPANKAELRSTCEACWNREMPMYKIDEKYEADLANETTPMWPKENPHILDSGERRQFETGAVRDIQEGKGRCDLMPLRVAAKVIDGDSILDDIGLFRDTGDTQHLYFALRTAARMFDGLADMLLQVAKHFEEGAKKYGENNWQKGLPVHCYIDSAVRHYLKWLRGDKDEPHDRAFVWNLLCCIWEVDFSPRAKMNRTPIDEELQDTEANSGRFYICNRTPCETCHSDCHCTEYRGEAAVLELCDRDVRYDECPVGLFMTDADGVFLKTEIINAETGLNTAVHIGLGLSRKFEADTVVTPIKCPFKERERE